MTRLIMPQLCPPLSQHHLHNVLLRCCYFTYTPVLLLYYSVPVTLLLHYITILLRYSCTVLSLYTTAFLLTFGDFPPTLLLLYCYFTATILLRYYFTTAHTGEIHDVTHHAAVALYLYSILKDVQHPIRRRAWGALHYRL